MLVYFMAQTLASLSLSGEPRIALTQGMGGLKAGIQTKNEEIGGPDRRADLLKR